LARILCFCSTFNGFAGTLIARAAASRASILDIMPHRSIVECLHVQMHSRPLFTAEKVVIATPFQIALPTPVACGRLPIPLKSHVIPAFHSIPLIHVVGVPSICCEEFQQNTQSCSCDPPNPAIHFFSAERDRSWGVSGEEHPPTCPAPRPTPSPGQEDGIYGPDPIFPRARLATTWPCSMLHNFDAMV
jgi:hypothetical protein